MVIAPDIQPGLPGQARRAAEEGDLRKAMGTLAGVGREAGIADGDRFAHQIGRLAARDLGEHLVERAAGLGVGAVDPERQGGVRQRPVVLLAQAGGGGHIGIRQVHLQATGAQGEETLGDCAAQLFGEGVEAVLGGAPQGVDDLFHSKVPHSAVKMAGIRPGRQTMPCGTPPCIVRVD
ncbi:hypothetical protein D9M68_832570 [compost metagenome]